MSLRTRLLVLVLLAALLPALLMGCRFFRESDAEIAAAVRALATAADNIAPPDGQLHCDSLQSGRVLNLSHRSYFKLGLAGGTGLMLEPVFGRLTGNSVQQPTNPKAIP